MKQRSLVTIALLLLALLPPAFALTPNGTMNITLYPGNPVKYATQSFETDGMDCAEVWLLPGMANSTDQYTDYWCHTNAGANYIEYGNFSARNVLNWTKGNVNLTDLGTGWSSPNVIKLNSSTYRLYAVRVSDHAIMAEDSTNKINFTQACGGSVLSPGTAGNTAAQIIDGIVYLVIQLPNGGSWDLHLWNSSDGCNFNDQGVIFANAYNPWFYRYNDSQHRPLWIFIYSTAIGGNQYDIQEARGNSLINLTFVQSLINNPTGQAWTGGHLGDSFLYVPNASSVGFFGQQYYFFFGNNKIGASYDADNRSFSSAFDTLGVTNSSGGNAPSSTVDSCQTAVNTFFSGVVVLFCIVFILVAISFLVKTDLSETTAGMYIVFAIGGVILIGALAIVPFCT